MIVKFGPILGRLSLHILVYLTWKCDFLVTRQKQKQKGERFYEFYINEQKGEVDSYYAKINRLFFYEKIAVSIH